MASNIIEQLQSAATSSATVEGVTLSRAWVWCDTFYGSADALIAAGVITADHLPGQPGMPKVSATFYNGVLCGTRGLPRDTRYMNVHRATSGKTVTVQIGISAEELAKRRAIKNAELAAEQTARQVKQTELPRVTMTEDTFRTTGTNMVMNLWLHARADNRARADMVPFELADGVSAQLLTALRLVFSIFSEAPLQSASKDRASLQKARNDSGFQSFLRAQCIPTSGTASTQRQ